MADDTSREELRGGFSYSIVRFTTRWFQLAGIYDPLLVFV
jgi:hypothetical protein